MVSTNRVYRLQLDDGGTIIAKSSNYGSFFLFAEDHDRLHRTSRLLDGGHMSSSWPAHSPPTDDPTCGTTAMCGSPFTVRSKCEITCRRFLLPNRSPTLAKRWQFHRATAGVARLVPPTSKTVTSDAIALYDLTASRRAADELSLDPSRIDLVRRHTHRFLMAVHESGYDYWAKQPVLIDWNLGNFSVDFSDSGRFRLFSRWDYDWFRYETRLLDFYFLSRVSSRTGDRSTFTYGAHTMFEPRFRQFLRAYHSVFPLSPEEVLFLKRHTGSSC